MIEFTHQQFLDKLSRKNKHFVNGVFTVEGTYIDNTTPILLKDKYGYCKAKPSNLYTGTKIKISSAIDKNLYFAAMAKELHGDKYNYDNVSYIGYEDKVEIICPIHGSFFQKPHIHLDKSGCPACGRKIQSNTTINGNIFSLSTWISVAEKSKNFNKYKVYIVRLFNDDEDFIKIGRTFTKTSKRFYDIPYNFEVIKNWVFYNADQAFDVENEIKRKYKKYRYKPLKKFDGSCECYTKTIVTETDITETIGLDDLVYKILDYEFGPDFEHEDTVFSK